MEKANLMDAIGRLDALIETLQIYSTEMLDTDDESF